jgi:hypothetical protein
MSPEEFEDLHGDSNPQRPPTKELATVRINPENFRKFIEGNDSVNLVDERSKGLESDIRSGLRMLINQTKNNPEARETALSILAGSQDIDRASLEAKVYAANYHAGWEKVMLKLLKTLK